MKHSLIAIIIICLSVCSCSYHPSKKTLEYDAAYLAISDSLNKAMTDYHEWHNREVAGKYGAPRVKVMNEMKAHPGRIKELQPIFDSLDRGLNAGLAESNARRDAIQKAISENSKYYRLISPAAFKSVFTLRHSMSREAVDSLYSNASKDVKLSAAGKAVHDYLYGKRVQAGDAFVPFKCFDSNGKKFDWSVIKGKKTIIIGDGLWCMNHGMNNSGPVRFFDSLREEYGDSFELIIYLYDQNKEGLLEQIEQYGLQNYTVVGDGLEFTPIRTMYDIQATPAVLYINPDGTLDRGEDGVTDYINEFLRK